MNPTESPAANRAAPGLTGRRNLTLGTGYARPPDAELARLKDRLLHEKLQEGTEPGLERLTHLAATEAEALSWLTSFPLLVFPVLLDEKLAEVEHYATLQRLLLRRHAGGGRRDGEPHL